MADADVDEAVDTHAAPDSATPDRVAPDLEVANLEVVYQDVILALRGVSLSVPAGEIVALLGANGAGKTSVLRAATGLLDVHRAEVTKGTVHVQGVDLTQADPARRVRAGLAQVMEGRRIFAELTLEENLRTGAFTRRNKAEVAANHARVLDLFPVLATRGQQTAGYLSGGEQQMLAIGRALMANPRVLVLDEPSLGLAPKMVEQIRDILVEVNKQGTSILLVEQNATMALSIAAYGYVMEHGRIVKDGAGPDLLADRDIREFYLGIGDAGRRSFRDVKTYRRRKTWGS